MGRAFSYSSGGVVKSAKSAMFAMASFLAEERASHSVKRAWVTPGKSSGGKSLLHSMTWLLGDNNAFVTVTAR
jgi:hypothetical protein